MKFKYLKLTLLMASLCTAPFAMYAEGEADVEAAALNLVDYLDPNGPQRSEQETIAMVDETLYVLEGIPGREDICTVLQQAKNVIVRVNVAEVQALFSRITAQLEAMKQSFSEATRNRVDARLEQLKNLNFVQRYNFLNKLGIKLPRWGKK